MSRDKEKREAKGSKNRVYPQERPSVTETPIALPVLITVTDFTMEAVPWEVAAGLTGWIMAALGWW